MIADDLTIVLPAFDETRRLPEALRRILEWREARRGTSRRIEVLVVDDGSRDGTGELVRRDFAGRVGLVTRARRGGKGAALRSGFEAVRTRWLCCTDADASIPIAEVERLFEHAGRAPLVIGSKYAPGAQVRLPLARRVMGRLGQALVRRFVVDGFHDTQCGMKLLRTDVARELARACRLQGFGFDFELLMLARRLGHEVVEVPVRCEHRPGGRVRIGTFASVLGELAAVVRNRRRGVYPGAAVHVDDDSSAAWLDHRA
jgi:dolichyl-phosphate beta-glucosyltransferase